MKILKTIIAILLFGATVHAQNKHFNNLDEVKAFTEKSVKLIADENYEKAFDSMSKYWDISKDDLKVFAENTAHSLAPVKLKFGSTIGYSKIKDDKISDFFIRETYIVRYNMYAIRYLFTYYKNNDGWVLFRFTWDDKIDIEFN